MRTIALLAATAILCAPSGLALAQTATDPGTPATTAAPPPPAPPAAAPAAAAPTAPANAPAPAAQSTNSPATNSPAASPPSANAPAATTDNAPNNPPNSPSKSKKKKATGTARRQEIEKSIDSGTVPSRYRSSVPKEYQQYIPFSKD